MATDEYRCRLHRHFDNHAMRLTVIDREIEDFSLVCPPACPTVVSEKDHYVPGEDGERGHTWPVPPLELVDDTGRYAGYRQCSPSWAQESDMLNPDRGMMDPDNLRWLWRLVKEIEQGEWLIYFEHETYAGWHPSTWMGPAEYEYEFYWWPVKLVKAS